MSWVQVVVLALGLSMDAFAVSLGASASGRLRDPRAAFRLSFHFGLFQFLMPLVGWLLASVVRQWIGDFDHWVAFALLWMVGLRMVYDAFKREEEEHRPRDLSRGISLLALSVAVSVDALAVGISLAFLDSLIFWPSVVIGCITGALSLAGARLGGRLGDRFGAKMEVLGGLLLLGIGVQIVLSHVGPQTG